ncbi:gastrula zinc finger protein XlCGF57.1 isoform X5 [Syngnathus scovelli]|uniref:gastrula zinc finger protein XlCGF57.1 isoform X5 n=1 Tax=Syngnathus scovelli TaxID=161590 RepID=UPI0035C9B72B
MFARTTAKYVEEKDRSPPRLNDLWLQPYVVLHRLDLSDAIRPEQQEQERIRVKKEDVGKEVHHLDEQMEQTFICSIKEEEPELPCIKEEREDSCDIKEEGEDSYDIKKEEEEEEICRVPLTGVPVTSLDEGQHEMSKGAAPPSCSSNQQMTREGNGDHCGGSQAAPPSESHDVLSHIPAAADDESQNKHSQCSQYGKCANNSVLKQHMRIDTRKKRFSCSDCGQIFSYKGILESHTRIHTDLSEQQEQERIHIKKEDVGKEVHHLNEQMEQTFLCAIKEEKEPELPCIKEEREDSCDIKEEGEDSCDIKKEEEEEAICNVPSTGVPVTSSDERQHKMSKGAEKPFSCSVCGQRFSHKGHLNTHTRIHTGEKPFSCSVCGKRVSHRGHLTIHTRTHTGEKPYSCSICGKIFSANGNLKKHTRIHTGEKPFSCSICGKRFPAKRSLTSHTRTHTGEKPFPCSVCGKRFNDKEYLKKHTRIHTGEKPFSCPVCGKRFSVKGYLPLHIRLHAGEKPFSCSVCGKKFSLKGTLKSHTRLHTRLPSQSPAKESIENS